MMKRNNKKGFTLVELMVVILILGILGGTLAVAVFDVFGGAQAKIDAQTLGKFQQNLALKAQEKRKQFRDADPKKGKGTFIELMTQLYDLGVLKFDDVKKLAGASGDEPDEGDFDNGDLDAQSQIIFTGPNTGSKIYSLMKGSTKDGVMFCYNKYFYQEYANEGIVVMFAGKAPKAEVLFPAAIEQKYNKVAKKPCKFKGKLEEIDDKFYGKAPFKMVEPE